MLEIDKYVYRAIVFSLLTVSVSCVFGALGIALKSGDAPANLATLGTSLFGITIAFVAQRSK